MYLIKKDLITDTREKQRKPQNAQRQEKYRYRLFEDKIVRKYNLEMAKYTDREYYMVARKYQIYFEC